MDRRALGLLSLLLGAACNARGGGAGDACTRSSQCGAGLACIEQRCSDDLSAIAEQSEVPELMPMAQAAAADGAADDDAGP
jgi:hypothetical protein